MNLRSKNLSHQLYSQYITHLLFLTLVFTFLLNLIGCSNSNPNSSQFSKTLYKNGVIYTVNPNQVWAQAILIEGNIITFIGSNEEAENLNTSGTNIIDLSGKMMMPGFHDTHIHALESGSEGAGFVLDTQETNAEAFIPIIRQAAAEFPDSEWLTGYGHDNFSLLLASRNPVDILDEAVPDRPVIIMEQTSHSMWVNSMALALAGITKETVNPIGGIIMKDQITGEPNGILIDNAGNLVMDIAMAPTPEIRQNDYNGLINYTLPELAKNGITSISDARAYWKRDHHKTWEKLNSNNKLTARVVLGLWAYPDEDDVNQIEMLKSLYTNNENSLLRINQIKFYSDGISTNTTAAMHTPYLIDYLDIEGNRGLNYFTQERLEHYMTQLEPFGFDFHIHAIGERGIFEALNAIENASNKQGRHRLTHLEIVDPLDYNRFSELNVTADSQVAGEFTHPEYWEELSVLIGSEKAQNIIPLRSLKDANARLTLSSDWSVSPFNPFIGLQNSITRSPQNLTLEEAIKAYTIDSAYVLRQEDKVGSLEVGKEADLIVLDQNIFEIDIDSINQTKVLLTLLAGKEVYRSPLF